MTKTRTAKAFNDLLDALRDEYPEGEGLTPEVQAAILISLYKTIEKLGLTVGEDGTIKEPE